MKRTSFAIFALVSTLATAAIAKSDPRAGTEGHVTAYETDGVSVIDVDSCARKGGSWDYVTCGKAFRDKIKARLCAERGQGKHEWLYQVSDSKSKTKNTANCK
jgi:hypothetical protein